MARKKTEIQSVAFVSLGCPKNLVDSERMLGLLAQDGLAITPDATSADAVVINTCGFLEASKEESLREIRQAVELKKTGRVRRVVVAGCLVQRHKTKLLDDVPEIDRLVGVFDREHIVEAVRGKENPRQEHGHYLGKYHDLSRELAKGSGFRVEGSVEESASRDTDVPENNLNPGPRTLIPSQPATLHHPSRRNRLPVFEDDRARLRLTPRHFAYLRMSEGCNQGCAFCTIPGIRGPMRSKPMEQILAEARELAADGAVELNLIGQDTTSYGTDLAGGGDLSSLLRTLNKQLPRDVRWIRLMYAYPSCFTDDMIRTIADSDRVVKYIDMPLQHINDRLLALMKRRVTRKEISMLLGKLRDWVPGISIRTTFIAGSPTETAAEHQELVDFVRDFGFDMMGVFPYSPEPGTPMGRMSEQAPDDVKQRRVEELMLAQQEVAFARNAALVGKEIEVLVDRVQPRDASHAGVRASARMSSANAAPTVTARHQGQAPDIDSVVFVNSANVHPGEFLTVKVSDYQAYDLVAEPKRAKSRKLAVIASSK